MEIDSTKTLFLSDDFVFYTLEGEGEYIGHPSVFMRLSMCNLTCIGFKSEDAPFGCDSYVSWSKKNKMTFEEIAQYFEKNGYHDRLKKGAIFKITGGEPFIQQKNLLEFVKFVHKRWDFSDYGGPIDANEANKPTMYIDFETNGTLMPDKEWLYSGKWVCTFTTSPKLSNNGDPEDKRFKPDVLKYLAEEGNACFKFVAKKESDLDEVFTKFINNPDINLSPERIWIMPMCGSRKELLDVAPQVAEICKKYGFKFSNRLHLQIWDKALKV